MHSQRGWRGCMVMVMVMVVVMARGGVEVLMGMVVDISVKMCWRVEVVLGMFLLHLHR